MTVNLYRPSYRLLGILVLAFVSACASTDHAVNSGLWHYKAGLWVQAIPKLVDAIPELERANEVDHRVVTGYLALGHMAAADSEYQRAEAYFQKAQDVVRRHHAGNSTLTRNVLVESGLYYLGRERFREAVQALEGAAILSESKGVTARLNLAIDLDNLSQAWAGTKNHVQARATSDRSLQILVTLPPSQEVQATRGVVLYNRAYFLAESGQLAQAEAAYRESLPLVLAHAAPWRHKVVKTNYAKFLRQLGKHAEAQTVEKMAP